MTGDPVLDVRDALLRAGDRMGMKVTLLRFLAAELPDEPWLRDLELEVKDGGVVAHATHWCGTACLGHPRECLTAFKVEAGVSRREGKVMAIADQAVVSPNRLRLLLRQVDS